MFLRCFLWEFGFFFIDELETPSRSILSDGDAASLLSVMSPFLDTEKGAFLRLSTSLEAIVDSLPFYMDNHAILSSLNF